MAGPATPHLLPYSAQPRIPSPIPHPGGGEEDGMHGFFGEEEPASLQSNQVASSRNAGMDMVSPDKYVSRDTSVTTDWSSIRKKGLKDRDFNMAKTDNIVMPVMYTRQNQNPPVWQPMDHQVIKDLMDAVKNHGLGSPYQTTFERYI